MLTTEPLPSTHLTPHYVIKVKCSCICILPGSIFGHDTPTWFIWAIFHPCVFRLMANTLHIDLLVGISTIRNVHTTFSHQTYDSHTPMFICINHRIFWNIFSRPHPIAVSKARAKKHKCLGKRREILKWTQVFGISFNAVADTKRYVPLVWADIHITFCIWLYIQNFIQKIF